MVGKRGRSAVTGRCVKQSTVKRHPKTTTNESTSKRGKKQYATCSMLAEVSVVWGRLREVQDIHNEIGGPDGSPQAAVQGCAELHRARR